MQAKAVAIEKQGTAEANVLGLKYHADAQGITVALSQEAAGSVMPVDVGAFGQVEILVAAEQAARAREILDEIGLQPPFSEKG